MAIKARADITIKVIKEIDSCYRYYLLQASNLAKPQKPSVFPPTGSWDDTEPSYTEGSTNSLYFVDYTKYSDGDGDYSEVSLSTAYEASKIAYNKAVAAKNAADQVESANNKATEIIIGTQTASTNKFTGTSRYLLPSDLVDGLQIKYWLPFAGTSTAATLQITFSDGTTSSEIYCYYNGSTRLTTHCPSGSIINLTYRENVSISGSTTKYTGFWCDANYNTDTTNADLYSAKVKVGATAITRYAIAVANENGLYQNLQSGNAFSLLYPILYWSSSSRSANTEYASVGYTRYMSVNINSYTQTITLTLYGSVFIKGTISGAIFTPISTTPITQTIPTTEDGYQYLLLGTAISTTTISLQETHPIYQYHQGVFKTVEQIAFEAATTASAVKSLTDGWKYSDTIYIDGSNLYAGSVSANKIAANSITASQIATGAITSDEIAANAVIAGKIAAGAVTTDTISANAITSAKINSNAITADKIVAGAVTTAKIATGAVTANEIAANTITAAKIASATITGTQIAGGTITADKLAAGSITVGKMDSSTASQVLNSNIDIGGRNLVINALCGKYAGGNTSTGTFTNISVENNYEYETTGNPSDLIGFIAKSIVPGTITISGKTSLSTLIYYYTFKNDAGTIVKSQTNGSSVVSNGRFSFSLTAPSDGTVLNIGLGKYPYTENYSISYVKVEKGNKATDWTPAPEDVDSNIKDASTLANQAKTAASEASISAQNTSIALGNKVDTSVYESDKAISDGQLSDLSGYVSNWAIKNTDNTTDYTYINGGKISTGTIKADCIIGDTLGAIRANLGEVTTGKIKSPNYDTGNGVMLDFTGGATSDGLYVRSNTKGTTLKIDSDGTRVYGSDENTPVAEFVNTGVDCNKIKANTAELAGLILNKVTISGDSYETWFTLA